MAAIKPKTSLQKSTSGVMAVKSTAVPLYFQANEVIQGRWKVIMRIGAGSFGQIYAVRDFNLSHLTALKVEPVEPAEKTQLPLELKSRSDGGPWCRYAGSIFIATFFIEGRQHAAKLYGSGTMNDTYNYISMQLLGASISTLRHHCPYTPKRFSLKTMLRLSYQCVEALQDLHNCGLVHRDVKMSNFTMGLSKTEFKNTVYLIDFGLARFYKDENDELKEERERSGFRGTMRYCSLRAHERRDLSRADDLVSLFYCLYEILLGGLPWKPRQNPVTIYRIKLSLPLPELAKSLPGQEFSTIADHLDNLEFYDAPDYELLQNSLKTIMDMEQVKENDPWDWENNYKFLTA
uniref:non-specific serine/threonine protein kinase n=1 Tax=Romanomermis culicivorax TaxID=13658 RepID=A0A915KRL9_ROMCU